MQLFSTDNKDKIVDRSMSEEREIIWCLIQPLLRSFAERIAESNPLVSYWVDGTSNDAFLIRGFASLRKESADKEIAVSVDAAFGNGEIVLSSDACMEDGEVLACGPQVSIPLSAISLLSTTQLADWLKRFKLFLDSMEDVVIERLDKL